MKTVEVYRQIRFGSLVAFIATTPALITAGFNVWEVPYIHLIEHSGNITMNNIEIFTDGFTSFLVQKSNVLLTYFPPSFILGVLIARALKAKSTETVLRGLKRIEPKKMANIVTKLAKAQAKRFGYSPAYRIALNGVPIPYNAEAQSFFIAGQAGSGKTQAILSLTEQIKNFGETMIFYDRKPDFFPKYYRDGKDFLFYPKDERSICFNLLDQISEETAEEDISFIVSNIIPETSGSDPHWNQSARSVLKAVFVTLFFNTDRSNKEMVAFLRKNQGAKKLREFILTFPHAEEYGIDITATLSADKDGNIDNQGGSVFSTVDTYLEPLRNQIFISDNKPFSIRDFIKANEYINQDTRLFAIQTTKEQGAYSIWYRVFFSLLSREIRALPNRLDRRLWIFADEFQSLGKMPEIVDELPAEARSKGVCLVLATQSLAKIKEIYGNELMNSILANTKTKLIFSLGDPYSQKTMEEYFGRQEIEEIKESHSQGIGLESNRLNTTTNTTTKSAILGVELLSLKPLNAFVQIDEYVSKIEFSPMDIPEQTKFRMLQAIVQPSLEEEISTLRLNSARAWEKAPNGQEKIEIAKNFEKGLAAIQNKPQTFRYELI